MNSGSYFWQIAGQVFALWRIFLPPLLIILVLFVTRFLIPELFHRLKLRKKILAGSKWRSDRELIWMLRGMEPDEFEDYIAGLFSKMGFKTEKTGGPYDRGVDVIAEKDGIKHYIQCKKFITSQVGVSAVRDFYGAIADHLTKGNGYFITTNKFTLEAERFAEDKPIELIDGLKLIKYIRQADPQK